MANGPSEPDFLVVGEIVFHLLEVVQYNSHPIDEAVGDIRWENNGPFCSQVNLFDPTVYYRIVRLWKTTESLEFI